MKPIAMKCTQQDWEQIKPILEENNVFVRDIDFFKDYPYLVNNYDCDLRNISNTIPLHKKSYDREVFEEWNQQIFLEYCDIFELPKYFIIKQCNDPLWKDYIEWLNKTYNANYHGDSSDDYYGFYGGKLNGGTNFLYCKSLFENNPTEITLEYWNKCINKTQNKTEMSQKLTIKATEVLKIHEIACEDWKITISVYLSRIDKNQNITFTQVEVDKMFDAATPEQKPVLESIFGKKPNPIDYDRLKTGSIVKIKRTGQIIQGLNRINVDEPVNVIFYRAPYSIDFLGKFNKDSTYSSYCTFEQNGTFARFSSHENIDYITEVIKY